MVIKNKKKVAACFIIGLIGAALMYFFRADMNLFIISASIAFAGIFSVPLVIKIEAKVK